MGNLFGFRSYRLPLTVLLCATSISRADLGDLFTKYVDDIIPKTHEIAKGVASAKEMEAFVARSSVAQSHLAQVSKEVVRVQRLVRKLATRGGDVCPRAEDGSIDIRTVFSEITTSYQIANSVPSIRARTANFQKLMKEAKASCEAEKDFEAYDAKDLGFKYYVPGKPGLFEGVYVIFSVGENSHNNQGGGGVEAIPLVGSLVQMFNNRAIASTIDEQSGRLSTETVQTAQYRNYAREACRTIFAENASLYRDYSALANSLQGFAEKIPSDALNARIAKLQHCVDDYERRLKELLDEEAELLAHKKFGPQIREAQFAIQYPEMKVKVLADARRLGELEELPCGKAGMVRDRLDRALVLGRFARVDHLPYFKDAEASISKRRETCGEFE